MQRPSLLEWRSNLAPLSSDVETVWDFDARKALRPRQDPMEVDGEKHEAPDCEEAEARWVVDQYYMCASQRTMLCRILVRRKN